VKEKDGHLQFRILDVESSIGNGGWDPQNLRHHRSITHDPTVKYPSVWVRKLNSDMFRGRSDDERAPFCPRKI